jgi:tetratricopeptide (TPR) repeat protein
MQNPGTNQTELFAELFSIITSPDDSTLRSYDRDLYEAFPHCVALILALSTDLRPHTFASRPSRAGSTTAPRETTTGETSTRNSAPNAGVLPPGKEADALTSASELIATRRFPEAVAKLQTVLATQPNNVLALKNRGYAFLALGQYQKALEDYQMVLKLNPKDTQATQYIDYARKMLASAAKKK